MRYIYPRAPYDASALGANPVPYAAIMGTWRAGACVIVICYAVHAGEIDCTIVLDWLRLGWGCRL